MFIILYKKFLVCMSYIGSLKTVLLGKNLLNKFDNL